MLHVFNAVKGILQPIMLSSVSLSLSALVSCCCMTNCPKIYQIKTIYIYYFSVSVSQKSGHGLTETSASRCLVRLQLTCWPALGSQEKAQLRKDLLPSSFTCWLAGFSSSVIVATESLSSSLDFGQKPPSSHGPLQHGNLLHQSQLEFPSNTEVTSFLAGMLNDIPSPVGQK